MDEKLKYICNEHVIAIRILKDYKAIFTEDQEQIDLLNNISKEFFMHLHNMYWETFILYISRLTDCKTIGFGSKQKYNLVLAVLISENSVQTEILKERLSDIISTADEIREIRMKIVAHNDLEECISREIIKQNKLKIMLVEEIYSKISCLLNDIILSHPDGIQWEFNTNKPVSGKVLINYLQQIR